MMGVPRDSRPAQPALRAAPMPRVRSCGLESLHHKGLMFLTARQLEDLHRANGSNGHLVLPYRARLTPLAADWVRSRKIALGYSDDGARPENGKATVNEPPTPLAVSQSGVTTTTMEAAMAPALT